MAKQTGVRSQKSEKTSPRRRRDAEDYDANKILTRLVSRGLVPCEHNLQMWQCVDGESWGAAITAAVKEFNTDSLGDSLLAALVGLMHKTNRAADLEMCLRASASPAVKK